MNGERRTETINMDGQDIQEKKNPVHPVYQCLSSSSFPWAAIVHLDDPHRQVHIPFVGLGANFQR